MSARPAEGPFAVRALLSSPQTRAAVWRSLRSLAILGSGRMFARLLVIGAVPILSRLYDIPAFGLFGAFSTTCLALMSAAAICYEQGVVPAGSDAEAMRLTRIALAMVVLTGLALETLLAGFGPLLAGAVASARGLAGPLLLLVPLGMALNGTVQVLMQAANRNHLDGAISLGSGLRSVVMVGLQFGLSWLGLGAYGLVIGQLAGSAAAALWLGLKLSWPGVAKGEGKPRLLIATARRHANLPLVGAPRVLVEVAATVVTINLMTDMFGATEVGLFWMAQRVINLPGQLFDEPVDQIFLRNAAAGLAGGHGFGRPLAAIILGTLGITLPFVVFLQFGAGWLFGWALGADWVPAADYAKILSLGWLASKIAQPFSLLTVMLGRLRLQFWFEVVSQTARIVIVVVAHHYGSFLLCLTLLAAQEVISHLAFAGALLRSTSREQRLGRPAE